MLFMAGFIMLTILTPLLGQEHTAYDVAVDVDLYTGFVHCV